MADIFRDTLALWHFYVCGKALIYSTPQESVKVPSHFSLCHLFCQQYPCNPSIHRACIGITLGY